MSAPARLLSVRLQGFKSFADRTHVEFGPGISAIVGPNGSGKSNLADALRWALGEQGRALRTRKSEDVVWAGSEKRTNDFESGFRTNNTCSDAENIHVIVLDALASGIGVVAQTGADTGELVRRHTHANT